MRDYDICKDNKNFIEEQRINLKIHLKKKEQWS